jgi:two-component system, chemotaxis family, protein-glutamate methylesterase/glutaminase
MKNKIRVLIVDDNRVVRNSIKRHLSADPEIEVVAEAGDPYQARDCIEEYEPDVMTLDIDMPKMSGIEFLKKLIPQYPMPVIMVSSHTKEGNELTLEALYAGAVDFIQKPNGTENSMEQGMEELRQKIKQAATIDMRKFLSMNLVKRRKELPPPTSMKMKPSIYSLIAIGASTGGTVAARELLLKFLDLTRVFPPILIVQHMPPGFTKMYADRLREDYFIPSREAVHGEKLEQNQIYISPGSHHLKVRTEGNSIFTSLSLEEKVNGHRPSVDVLLNSILENKLANKTISVILTGMGSDGAKGITNLYKNGSRTIGQDEKTSVVYGMPRVAYELGGVEFQLPIQEIANKLFGLLYRNEK